MLTKGTIVHYVSYNNRHLAAMVIGHSGLSCDLIVFTNMENVNGAKNFGMQFHQDIVYSNEFKIKQFKPGTWHFIDECGE